MFTNPSHRLHLSDHKLDSISGENQEQATLILTVTTSPNAAFQIFCVCLAYLCSKFHLSPNFSYKTKTHSSNFPVSVFSSAHTHTTTAAHDPPLLGTSAASLPTTSGCSSQKGCTCPAAAAPCGAIFGRKGYDSLGTALSCGLGLTVKASPLNSRLTLQYFASSCLRFLIRRKICMSEKM